MKLIWKETVANDQQDFLKMIEYYRSLEETPPGVKKVTDRWLAKHSSRHLLLISKSTKFFGISCWGWLWPAREEGPQRERWQGQQQMPLTSTNISYCKLRRDANKELTHTRFHEEKWMNNKKETCSFCRFSHRFCQKTCNCSVGNTQLRTWRCAHTFYGLSICYCYWCFTYWWGHVRVLLLQRMGASVCLCLTLFAWEWRIFCVFLCSSL